MHSGTAAAMPLERKAVTLSFCQTARSSRTTMAILVVNTATPCGKSAARMPSGDDSVWKIRAAPPVIGRRHAEGAAEPAAEMALVGEACRGGDLGRRLPPCQQLPRPVEPPLHQIGMRRDAVGRLEGAGQAEAVGARLRSEFFQAEIAVVARLDDVAGAAGNSRRRMGGLAGIRLSRAAQQMR